MAFGVVGWPLLAASSRQLQPTVWTVVVLPVLTWASLTLGLIAFRLLSGSDLQVRSNEGRHFVAFGGVLLSGFWAVFLVLVLEWPPLWTSASYALVTTAFLLVYRRVILPRSTRPADP